MKCDVCGGPWDSTTDGIIGDGTRKNGLGRLTGEQIEGIWIKMGAKGYRVCSECFYK